MWKLLIKSLFFNLSTEESKKIVDYYFRKNNVKKTKKSTV